MKFEMIEICEYSLEDAIKSAMKQIGIKHKHKPIIYLKFLGVRFETSETWNHNVYFFEYRIEK